MTIVLALLTLGTLILIHEMGHLVAARAVGVDVLRFSVGFGPILVRRRVGGIEYCLSLIPFGGYVKLRSEPDAGGDTSRCFAAQPPWARFVVAFAGPAVNFAVAIVVFAIVLVAFGRPAAPPVVGRVALDGPAAIAGLASDDVVLSVDGRPVASWRDVDRAVTGSRGDLLTLRVRRGDAERTLVAMPRRIEVREPLPEWRWSLGAAPHRFPRVGAVRPGSPAG
ncbi:MAG: site-2 protease family protein, partial [Candidatus Rokuibacteriota bacterium]